VVGTPGGRGDLASGMGWSEWGEDGLRTVIMVGRGYWQWTILRDLARHFGCKVGNSDSSWERVMVFFGIWIARHGASKRTSTPSLLVGNLEILGVGPHNSLNSEASHACLCFG